MTEDQVRKLVGEMVKASYSFLAAPPMNSILAQQLESCLINFSQAAPDLSYAIPNANPTTLEALLHSVLQIGFNSAYGRFARTAHGEGEEVNMLTTVKPEHLVHIKRETEIVEVNSGAAVGGSNDAESDITIKRDINDASVDADVHSGAAVDSVLNVESDITIKREIDDAGADGDVHYGAAIDSSHVVDAESKVIMMQEAAEGGLEDMHLSTHIRPRIKKTTAKSGKKTTGKSGKKNLPSHERQSYGLARPMVSLEHFRIIRPDGELITSVFEGCAEHEKRRIPMWTVEVEHLARLENKPVPETRALFPKKYHANSFNANQAWEKRVTAQIAEARLDVLAGRAPTRYTKRKSMVDKQVTEVEGGDVMDFD
ncbi:hypothetical protein BUE80_DR004600 [Diplocarpon rosae]|nr:hypothetical protein BUE80_DR004600 [Diplocarpon rosae]